MFSRILLFTALVAVAGCSGSGSDELPVPQVIIVNGGTSAVSPQFADLTGVPAGVQVTFIGDVVVLRGNNFRLTTRAFFGMNNQLARRPDSLLTTTRHLLPGDPFVYTDPVTQGQTTLEVEAKVEFSNATEIRITVPAGVACSTAFTNPVIRLWGDAGSSFPEADVYFIIGPRCIALNPRKGVDIGGFSVTVHGDFFSFWTQIAFRYVDPADGLTKTIGNTPDTDITEHFIDRHTLVINDWPGVVPNSTFGLARELPVDVLLFENIDAITGDSALEPSLGGVSPCSLLQPSADVALEPNGVRNSSKLDGFIFTPTGVTDYPSIAGITPESGTEAGGNTVIIHGDQFDAFTVDTNPSNPGLGIECPPNSGNYIAPLSAVLVDRQTIALVMPPCAVDIPETVNFCLRNKYSIDNPLQTGNGQSQNSTANGTCVIFEDVYTYIPIPPILPPLVTAIYPAGTGPQPQGSGNDYGLQRFMVVGDWFDGDTTLNGGFEFLLPNGELLQSLRTILHNRNLIEIFTKPLPAPYYPLSADLTVNIRVRNVIGHADFQDAFVFTPMPDAGIPTLTDLCPKAGAFSGGNEVLVYGSNFDTTTTVLFDGTAATNVQFINSDLIIATVPQSKDSGGADLPVNVVVVDEADTTDPETYTYSENADPNGGCPTLGALNPNEGSHTGGYTILGYGINLTPLTRIEFGVDLENDLHSGNFSYGVRFMSDNLLLITVPEAFPDQIGATVGVGATDPLGGCPDVIKTVDFTWKQIGDCIPEIHFVDTSVEVPVTPTTFPALNVDGGDRMLVIGKCFDQVTDFSITKPQTATSGVTFPKTSVTVLTPNLAVMFSPASPDKLPGLADLRAHNSSGDSDPFVVEYVAPPPPTIIDVRNLDTGTTDAPIDANDRLLVFGDNFFAPVTVRLTGGKLGDPGDTTVTLTSPDVTLVEDHIIGVNVPPNTFRRGPLEIEVETPYGTAKFEDAGGAPIFMLLGPQPPLVTGVFPSIFNSNGGEEAVFFGRNFTATTDFSVRSSLMTPNTYVPVLEANFVSETVVLVLMPALPGGVPPTGAPGDVRAEETDSALITKIAPTDPFTVAEGIITILRDDAPVLLSVHPDNGSTNGGEQVLLVGANFLKATGEVNIKGIEFFDPKLNQLIGTYTEVAQTALPLDSLDPSSQGKYHVINDHLAILVTNPHAKITPEDQTAPVNVTLVSDNGDSTLNGGYTYLNEPAELTPYLLGITPNETRLNGGTSHLISGGFLTSADRIVFTKGSTTLTIPVDAGSFAQVNDSFLVFVMPDLSSTFAVGDVLDVHAEKDVGGSALKSNVLKEAIAVSHAGPPTINPTFSKTTGSAFGGDIVEITGTLFTTNSQVLFGTIPARLVVWESATKLIVITPALPMSAPAPGRDLTNISATNGKVDAAVFTQGGWAVVKDGFQFTPETPVVDTCNTPDVAEKTTTRMDIWGNFFVPGSTSIVSNFGTITNLQVDGFTHASFDFTAPDFTSATSGPVGVSLELRTTQGGAAAKKCTFDIHLDPELTSCATDFADPTASPTTGVVVTGGVGRLVKGTLKGKNLLAGGTLTLQVDTNSQPITLTEVPSLTAGGQFMVDNGGQITFSIPNKFNNNTPTLLDGNPNVGFTSMDYTSPYVRSDDLDKCFRYVPAVINFASYAFAAPTVAPTDTSLDKVSASDINDDGVLDIVVLARQGADAQYKNAFTDPDGFVYFADTFGSIDINGDGLTPDFAGTFTKKVISNDKFRTNLYIRGRGGIPRLVNLDGDDQLEIVLPGQDSNGAAFLIVDVKSDGTLGSETIVPVSSISDSAVAGIAVGNFNSSHSGKDIAVFVGTGSSNADRDIILFASKSTPFSFTATKVDVDGSLQWYDCGYLEAGDFDDDGDDDLVWGTNAGWAGEVVIGTVNAATGTVTAQNKIGNVNGGNCTSIAVFDADGDGKDDIFPLFEDGTSGTLGDPNNLPGFVSILDPMNGFTANKLYLTGFASSGRALDNADFNGDQIQDLAITSNLGETIVFFGDGKGGFEHAGRTWTLPTVPGFWPSRVHGLAAGDLHRDGLAEIFVGDIGANPMSLIVWLNTSR